MRARAIRAPSRRTPRSSWAPADDPKWRSQMPRSLRFVLAAVLLAASWLPVPPGLGAGAARAGDPGVRADVIYNGMVRITLEGSYSGSHYTVRRADAQGQPFAVLGEMDALCIGDCTILD